jgi:hypothetical protein
MSDTVTKSPSTTPVSPANPNPAAAPAFPSPLVILRQTIDAFGKRWRTLLTIDLLGLVPLVLAGAIGAAIAVRLARLFVNNAWQSSPAQIFSLIVFVVALIIIIISQVWQSIALVYAIKDRQKEMGAIEAYQASWKKIIPFCWTGLLATIIIISGLFLFIIPGLVFSFWFSLTMYIVMVEDVKGINALLKSREYIRGQTKSLITHWLVVMVLYLIITSRLVTLIDADIFTTLFNWLFHSLLIIYMYLLYENLKTFKGEFDFTPSKGKKIFFIGLAILTMIVIIGGGAAFFSKLLPEIYSYLRLYI